MRTTDAILAGHTSASAASYPCHVRCVYRSLEDVVIPRCCDATDQYILIASHGENRVSAVAIPRAMCLRTMAFSMPRSVYRRCIQYDTRGCCEAGELCHFTHVVDIDPTQRLPRRRMRMSMFRRSLSSVVDLSESLRTPSNEGSKLVLDVGKPHPSQRADDAAEVPHGSRWWRHDPYSALDGETHVVCSTLFT